MGSAVLRDDYLPLTVGSRGAKGHSRGAVAKHPPRATRLDLCRLTVSIFGLAIYLGLPAAALIYLGLEIGERLAAGH